ncbi:MAG: hypothetical protein HY903_16315 [Deltaproteobacteria bacterium]|nr:hypothetical protein [Deltaproteobacteria bacterium]
MPGHLIVGDGHYQGLPGETERLARLLEAASRVGVDELSILGDFFELWLALPGMDPPGAAPLWELLRARQLSGWRLRYVVGNRDYFVAQWNARARLFGHVEDPGCVVEGAAGKLVLAHGDLVNRADRQYRRWRRFSRNPIVSLMVRSLPQATIARLGTRTAARLKATNRYHKSYFPEAELRARAREYAPGPATLIFGHFHEHHDLVEGDKRIITLPFLGRDNAGLLVDAGGLRLFTAP